ncbi:peptidoglycan-binding protein [Kitasatospora sp. GAS1066B]|uniref:peptidoglycan-binding protein n=1 Tax=Kitasatospora sp. GAS1066B TaxID=3156271 RepID=UPI003512A421
MTHARKRSRRRRLALAAAVTLTAGSAYAVAQSSALAGVTSHPAQPGATGSPAPGAPGPTGKWISYTPGHLTYGQDAQGNRIPDYSAAGYAGGGVPLPTVPTNVTVPPPSGNDDTAVIQAALDKAAALPLDPNGFRGAVQLAPGKYQIAGSLTINASGVVLRGAGTDAGQTSLVAQNASARTLLTIGGDSRYQTLGTPQPVTDTYVPVGATSLTMQSTAGFKVGDQVVIERPTTQAWIDAIGMNGTWSPNWSLRSERTITAIQGDEITFDAPLTTALEKQYTQASVYHYSFPRINHVGIENLSSDGQAMAADPNYQKDFYNSGFAVFNAVEDSWVSNVTTHHYGDYGVALPSEQSRRISEVHTSALDMVTYLGTSARSFGYLLEGQQNLIQDCTLTAAKIHAFVTEGRQAGPNVFSHCTATTTDVSYDAGGHERWGSGTLYDDVNIQGSLLMVDNGTRGTGHGWSDANSTAWNCRTTGFEVQNPPTAHNWAIGCTGSALKGTDGELESAGTPVGPTSLYDEQLHERQAAAAKKP